MPILPTPTKPTVSMSAPLRYFDRLIGKIDAQAERPLHDRPFLEFVSAKPVDDERIGVGQRPRLSALAARKMVSPAPLGGPRRR